MGCTASSSVKIQRQHVLPAISEQQVDSSVNDCILCKSHGNKLFTKYHEKERLLFCDLCLLGNRTRNMEHKKQLVNISDYVQSIKFKQKKIKLENEIRSKKRDINYSLTDVNDNAVTLEAQQCNLIEEINNFRKAVIDILNYLCDGLCDNIRKIYEVECTTTEQRKKILSDYLKRLVPGKENDETTQDKNVLMLINVLKMEDILSSLSKQDINSSFVDMQLKLHDNISLRHLLQCDQTASSLGEVIVLRNVKSERPCTKELIVHDISDTQESDEEATIEKQDKDVSDHSEKLSENNTDNRSILRSTTPQMRPKQKADPEHLVLDNIMKPTRGTISRMFLKTEKKTKNSTDGSAPIRSSTPRMLPNRKTPVDTQIQNDSEAKGYRSSRMSQSVKSNFSIMTPSAIQFGTPVNERKLFERNAALVKSISLPIVDNISDITCSVLLPNGNILLCDRSNRKLWYFDPTFSYIGELIFDEEPFNICTINDSTLDDDFAFKVAVCFPKAKLIEILNVASDHIIKVDEIRTEPECWGIGCNGKSLVFSTEKGAIFRDVSGYRNYKWRKYRYSFQTPISLTVVEDLVYVCNWGLEEVPGNLVVMYFDDRGKNQIKFSYSNRSLQRPVSCSVDSEGNIYVCDSKSPGIHQVSCDGNQYRILDINGGQNGSWQHINFVPCTDYFILTEAGSGLLYVFQMK